MTGISLFNMKLSSSSTNPIKIFRSRRFQTPSISQFPVCPRYLFQAITTFMFILSLYMMLSNTNTSSPNVIHTTTTTSLTSPIFRHSSFQIPIPSPPAPVTFTGPYPSSTVAVPVVDVVDLYNQRQKQDRIHDRLISQLPTCSHHGPAKTFLMIFMGHSGSTALMTSLKQHSGTYIQGLEPVDHGKFVAGKKGLDNAKLALEYTREYFNNATRQKLTAGFKIRPLHIHKRPKEFQRLVRRYRTRIVWSFRTNLLKQAIGDYAIHYYGDKSAYEGLKIDADGTYNDSRNDESIDDRRSKSFKITDMKRLYKLMQSRVYGDKAVSYALRAMRPDGCVLPVSYESYLNYPELTLERIHRFLGLDVKEIHPPLRRKANQDSICDLVENWEDICEAFFGCVQWRWMLDDFENGCSCSRLNPSRFRKHLAFCRI